MSMVLDTVRGIVTTIAIIIKHTPGDGLPVSRIALCLR